MAAGVMSRRGTWIALGVVYVAIAAVSVAVAAWAAVAASTLLAGVLFLVAWRLGDDVG